MRNSDDHHRDCGYHADQYPWECTCGAVQPPGFDGPVYREGRWFLRGAEVTQEEALLHIDWHPESS